MGGRPGEHPPGNASGGFVRGNHRHRRSREWIVFLEAPVEVALEAGDECETFQLKEPSRVYLPPGIAHAFRNPGPNPITFVAYRDIRYDEENPDVEPRELLAPQ